MLAGFQKLRTFAPQFRPRALEKSASEGLRGWRMGVAREKRRKEVWVSG